jgi:hypothetical protein
VFRRGISLDYERLTNRTLSLITKYGTSCTLSYFSAGTYNVVEGSYSGSTYNNIAVQAVFDSPNGSPGRQGIPSDILTTILSQKLDCIAYVPASGLTQKITIADRLLRDGEIYEILYPMETKPSSTSLLWTLYLRKG